jgi:hypothetical protein
LIEVVPDPASPPSCASGEARGEDALAAAGFLVELADASPRRYEASSISATNARAAY